jgi:hypothetical protein
MGFAEAIIDELLHDTFDIVVLLQLCRYTE